MTTIRRGAGEVASDNQRHDIDAHDDRHDGQRSQHRIGQAGKNRGLDRPVAVARAKFCCNLGEQGAIAFPAGAQQMLGDLGEELVVRFRHLEEAPFDRVHSFPHTRDGYEVAENGPIHGSPKAVGNPDGTPGVC